ncbi:MAG: nucleotidyltransferase [Candidatus Omnitrophica bacterium]|nr:nucleotidyltransferase [Candidatus Omnitrophota bacterium]
MSENDYVLKKFKDAFDRLKEGAASAEEELQRDGVIQRFEFTFELLWKTLKIFMRQRGLESNTPKDALREAFRLGWLSQEVVFLNMLEDRNKTSHIYESKVAKEIFERIQNQYIEAISCVINKLDNLA